MAEPGTKLNRFPIFFLYLAACLSGIPAYGAETPACTLKRVAAIDLMMGKNGQLLVPVTVGDTSAKMALRTENWFSIIREDAAQRLGLPLKPGEIVMKASLSSASGPSIKKKATVANFLIGPTARFKNAEFVVGPSAGDEDIIGVLGSDYLGTLDMELDLANNTMNLYSPDHCPGHVVYWAKDYTSMPILTGKMGQLYFPMELDGKPIGAILATGNESTTLPTDVTKTLFGFDGSSPGVETRTATDGKEVSHYRAMDVTSKGFRLINGDILLTEPVVRDCKLSMANGSWGYENCTPNQPLRLGRSVLKKLRLYVAVKEKVLYVTPAEVAKSEATSP